MPPFIRVVTAASLLFAFQSAAMPQQAIAAEQAEYCIKGPNSKLVHFRDGPRASSQEAGLARGGDCGMWKVKCSGAWCKMQMHEFDAWIEKKHLRRK